MTKINSKVMIIGYKLVGQVVRECSKNCHIKDYVAVPKHLKMISNLTFNAAIQHSFEALVVSSGVRAKVLNIFLKFENFSIVSAGTNL